jgi:hypothetical protein
VVGVRLVSVGAVVVLVLSACAKAPADNRTGPVSSPNAVRTSPAGPALGQSRSANNGQVQATVYGYRPLAGAAFAAADVQVCVVSTAIFDVTVSQGPWFLLFADGPGAAATVPPDVPVPQPGYPTDHRRLPPNGCVRGWVVFPVPAGQRPVAVQYSPAGATPLSWPVS